MDVGHFRQFAREFLTYALTRRRSRLVRGSFLAPRVLRSLLGGDYSKAVVSFGRIALYLIQLEELASAKER
jgi:hypothetical protein